MIRDHRHGVSDISRLIRVDDESREATTKENCTAAADSATGNEFWLLYFGFCESSIHVRLYHIRLCTGYRSPSNINKRPSHHHYRRVL